ncbi:hypothetical protein FSARC_8736 [Fusarium sarcochroum]|uniref:Uncharacterized protein n=1 Tax=Fusarium sarcochroum TaxID=1208366 RepID=A0A8H4TSC1_9HYPO|nr:hypothetical protein FSARC_8736 [Fusarium sarcochroum]
MANDPVKHNQKKSQDNDVAYTGAWTQVASSSPSPSVAANMKQRVDSSKSKSSKKNLAYIHFNICRDPEKTFAELDQETVSVEDGNTNLDHKQTGQENSAEGRAKAEDKEDGTESDSDERPNTALDTHEGFLPLRPHVLLLGRSQRTFVRFPVQRWYARNARPYVKQSNGAKGSSKGLYFYGIEYTTFKLPIEGWRVVRDGMLTLEGEEPVAMDKFLEKARTEVYQEARDRLGAGDF